MDVILYPANPLLNLDTMRQILKRDGAQRKRPRLRTPQFRLAHSGAPVHLSGSQDRVAVFFRQS